MSQKSRAKRSEEDMRRARSFPEAYSPLGQGVLTGKYSPTNQPSGARARVYNEQFMTEIDPLVKRLKAIGQQSGGKTPTQVALNWLLAQGNVIPIPGAKSASQAQEFAGALGWSLSDSEVESSDLWPSG